MKLARFAYQNTIWLGLVNTENSTVDGIVKQNGTEDMTIDFITASADKQQSKKPEITLSLDQVHLLPPIEKPSRDIICIGKNYADHAAEFAGSGYDSSAGKAEVVPTAPIVFGKVAGSMIGAFDEIHPPWALSTQIDYEAELGVIIGRDGVNIASEDVFDYIWGYTIINDVTARDVQSLHQQWLLGKSIDTFCPIGPWIVSADELDPTNLEISSWVNGERRQHANTRDMVFDIPAIVSTVSAGITLRAGDIIATGTPAGVGIGFDPPRFLESGDVVSVVIESIGEIRNTVK